MPYTETFPLGGNGDIIQDLLRRIEVLEKRSKVLQNGSIIVQDATGTMQAIIGQLPDGTYGIQAGSVKLNANGVIVATGSGSVTVDSGGLHVYDASSNEEVRAGLLNATPAIYGLGVRPYGGTHLQQVGGSLQVNAPTASSVTSNGVWTNFGSPSSITCEVGPSGQVEISVSGFLGTFGSNQQGLIGVAIDGTNVGTWASLSVAAAGGVSGFVGSSYTLPPGTLSVGSHTFQLQYQTGANAESFTSVSMAVQPL